MRRQRLRALPSASARIAAVGLFVAAAITIGGAMTVEEGCAPKAPGPSVPPPILVGGSAGPPRGPPPCAEALRARRGGGGGGKTGAPGGRGARQAGWPGYVGCSWGGFGVPAAPPKDIIARRNQEFVGAMSAPDMREQLLARGAEPHRGTPEQFAAFMRAEIVKWAKVVKDSNIKAD